LAGYTGEDFRSPCLFPAAAPQGARRDNDFITAA
jgi:hypothetical protein